MPLILTIQSIDGQACVADNKVIIDESGGSIGRSDSSSLVLPDENKLISRCHAKIDYIDGKYILSDNSLAGCYINNATSPLNNTDIELLDGMLIGIGNYDILVSISNSSDSNEAEFEEQDIFSSLLEEGGQSIATSPFSVADPVLDPSGIGNNPLLDSVDESFVDPFANKSQHSSTTNDLLNGSENELANSGSELLAENISNLNDSYIPPSVEEISTDSDQMPDDFNFEDLFDTQAVETSVDIELLKQGKSTPPIVNNEQLGDQVVPEQIVKVASKPEEQLLPMQQTQVQNSSLDSSLFQSFLTGAGLEAEKFELIDLDQKMSAIGGMFRQFVESTISVLRSRAEFKSLFRVSVTTIKRADNNPLKFSVTTDEALKHLINDGQGGFKPSTESIDEGFNDLLNHQLAMQAGIQASLSDILEQFNPANIEKQYEEGIVLQKKSKCWEKYNKLYAKLSESAVDDFFGDAFSEAYEKQMKQLKP